MADKQIIIDNLTEQLKRKEQEYKALKAENEELRQFLSKEPLAIQALQKSYESYQKSTKVFGDWVKDYKQLITEIKEIADGMHDLWINKTPYTDIDNLVKHLLECELNRIRYKFDDISEVIKDE